MTGRSIVWQVVWATVFVAFVTSIALAATAALSAQIIWRARERQEVRATATDMVRALHAEADEDHVPLAQAAQGAVEESALAEYQVEIWQGSTLLAIRPKGSPIGPMPGTRDTARDGWLITTRELPEGLTLIVGFPVSRGLSAVRVFVLSLAISVPLSLMIAICIGWFVGRRVTWPIVDFTRRVARTAEMHGLEPVRGPVPTEIRDLEGVFQDLVKRLLENVSRELEFATNASHELRTPLTAIRMNAERALRDAGATGTQELTDQLREIDRMVKLIDSLLVMARDAQAGMPKGEVVNVADLAREIAGRVLADGSSAQISLPDEALVMGDENLLGIAIENLIDNARKFTREGAPIKLSLPSNGPRVRLFVTSPGARVPADKREAIFERFYRDPATRAALPGHGLGLPLSRHIARLHGGNVACVSDSEEDACFVLELPGWTSKSGAAPGS